MGPWWSQVVAVWSQSGALTSSSGAVTGPLSWGFGGAPRGIRTPNRQIRSQPPPVPARPPIPVASLLVLVNGHVAVLSRVSVPARHAPHGRNVVAASGRRRQTGSLALVLAWAPLSPEHQILSLVVTGRCAQGVLPNSQEVSGSSGSRCFLPPFVGLHVGWCSWTARSGSPTPSASPPTGSPCSASRSTTR